MYDRFSQSYSPIEREKYNLMRVDSTLAAEAAGKLKEGIDQKSCTKIIKYSIPFDGILSPQCQGVQFPKYSAKDNVLAEAVKRVIKMLGMAIFPLLIGAFSPPQPEGALPTRY